MGFWSALQIIFDVLAGFGIFILLLKLARAPKDDPRLSRGLQILQSKIAILEDLSDRTENQVRGLMTLLDQKTIEVQTRIDKANEQVRVVDDSIRSSMDVAKIFQDKIPHQEIIERKNTLKYLQAARLANQGRTAVEIAQSVDLPMGEIEFIAKVNRDQLSFSMDDLPPWAKAELTALETRKDTEPQESTQSVAGQFPQGFAQNTNLEAHSRHQETYPESYSQNFETNQESARHPYRTDLNFLGNSNDERTFEFSQEIAPLASYANEPQFQAFQNFSSRQAQSFQENDFSTTETNGSPVETRELSENDNRQISTLKRTQSIIANLDRQFLMSGLDVQGDDEILPPTPNSTYLQSAQALMQVAIPVANFLPPVETNQQMNRQSLETNSEVKTPTISTATSPATTSKTLGWNSKVQAAKTYDPASIRRVIFPTISSQKVNNRFAGR